MFPVFTSLLDLRALFQRDFQLYEPLPVAENITQTVSVEQHDSYNGTFENTNTYTQEKTNISSGNEIKMTQR